MVAGSVTEEYESPIPLLKAWKAGVLDAHIMIPKLLPDIVSSVDVLEGNGGVGTVKQFNFTQAVKEHKFIKDRVDVLDDQNCVFKYTVIEGGLLGTRLKSYSYELKLEATGGGGSKGELTVHYDTIDDTPLTEEEVGKLMIGVVGMMKALEVYFQANPSLYA